MKFAQKFQFDPGTVVVDDRAYNDYRLFGQWTTQGGYFVTRIKDNAQYRTVGKRKLPQNRKILKDELIEFAAPLAKARCPHLLRRIEVYNPEKDEILVFLTNHLDWGSTTIAPLYKDRWQIEAFSRALKQNLKIKTFFGISPNAVKIQVWTALIAMLICVFSNWFPDSPGRSRTWQPFYG